MGTSAPVNEFVAPLRPRSSSSSARSVTSPSRHDAGRSWMLVVNARSEVVDAGGAGETVG